MRNLGACGQCGEDVISARDSKDHVVGEPGLWAKLLCSRCIAQMHSGLPCSCPHCKSVLN